MRLTKIIDDIRKRLNRLEMVEVDDVITIPPISIEELEKIEKNLKFSFPLYIREIYLHDASMMWLK